MSATMPIRTRSCFMAVYEFEDRRPVIAEDAYLHPEAVVIGSVKIGNGCFIGAGAVIRGDFGDIEIGRGSNVQENAVIHASPAQPVIIEDDVIIAHGALIHDATIRNGAIIGMGAIVLHGAIVEKDAMAAAGSLIPSRFVVPERKIAMGNPAVIQREVSDKMLEINKLGLAAYQELPGRYFKGLKKLHR